MDAYYSMTHDDMDLVGFNTTDSITYLSMSEMVGSYFIPITTLLGQEDIDWNVPKFSWERLNSVWSNRHRSGDQLSALPDLGYYTQGELLVPSELFGQFTSAVLQHSIQIEYICPCARELFARLAVMGSRRRMGHALF